MSSPTLPVERETATLADLDALVDDFQRCDVLERRPLVHLSVIDDARRFRSPAGHYCAEINRDSTKGVRGTGYTYCAFLQWSTCIVITRHGTTNVSVEYERSAGWIPLLTTEQPITGTGEGDGE